MMAWIKIRVLLPRDPTVILMADHLACDKHFVAWLTRDAYLEDPCRTAYEHVTRNVTVALCVTGLVTVWGTGVECGCRIGDDLVLSPCSTDAISVIADIPSFGDAMAMVGWLVDNKDGTVVFPKYFTDKENQHVRHRLTNAERQARYREKQRNESNGSNVTDGVTSNVTRNVTNNANESREEERREELPPTNVGGNTRKGGKRAVFVPPTCEEVECYAREIGWPLDGKAWCDSYAAKGWCLKGGARMKDWKAAVRNWKHNKWRTDGSPAMDARQQRLAELDRQLDEMASEEPETPTEEVPYGDPY